MSTRRLAAVLAADVVGFSKLRREDEAGTLAALREIARAS
jgi:class 3 adenylate cyclase